MSGTLIANLPAAVSVNDSDLMIVEKIGTPNVTERASRAQVFAPGGTMGPTTINGNLTVVNAILIGPASANIQGTINDGVSITGTNTNDNALAGTVGEFVSFARASGSSVSMSNNTNTDIISISLTAGDWDVWGTLDFQISVGATGMAAWVNTTSVTQPATPNGAIASLTALINAGATSLVLGTARLSLAVTTTVFMSGITSFASGTVGGFGFLGARRVR